MKIIAVVCFCVVVFAGLGAGAANARTPTPTSTATPSPPATATPSGPPPALFAGHVWVNARIVGDRDVTAKIGDTVCGTAHPPYISPTSGGAPTYGVFVSSDEAVPGCGREGAIVTFFVGDQRAPQTAVWHSGIFQGLALIIGPPFAYIAGVLHTNLHLGTDTVVPYVGNQSCGDNDPSHWIGMGPDYGYGVVVFSNDQQPGCGREDTLVTFKLLDARGNIIAVANQKGTWHAWDGISDPQRLDLTFGPAAITMPGTGTGDRPRPDATTFATLAIALSGIGLVGLATAAALRKQTTTP